MPPELQDRVLSNITVLLSQARSSGIPVVFIQHDGPKGHPIEAETAAWAIHPSISPLLEEPVIRKKASDSFFETRLAEELQTRMISHLVIAGGMTEYCIDTTCRRAVTLGYDVTLVADAHLTRETPALRPRRSLSITTSSSTALLPEFIPSKSHRPERFLSETRPRPSRNTAQCAVDAIEVLFLRIQARAFAKSLPDTRTYLVCTRKQPKIWQR